MSGTTVADEKEGVVLVVDDSIIACKVLSRDMAPHFKRVLTTTDSTTICEMAVREKVDCVVMDLLMPEVDGYEAMQRIFTQLPGVRVILVSADIQNKTRQKALELGAFAFFNKPVAMPDLIKTIQKALQKDH